MKVETINIWRFWKFGTRDFVLIEIDFFCDMERSTRMVLCNVGFKIKWNKRMPR